MELQDDSIMKIRQAEPSDVEMLSKLAMETYAAAFGHSFSPADLAAHLEKSLSPNNFKQISVEDTVLVAEVEDCMIGYVQFGKCDFEEATSDSDQELRRLYVLAEFQNKGVGALLMSGALNHQNLKNARQIFLDVWEHNSGAQRFYVRYGFEVIGKREFVVESGAKTSFDLIMVRDQSKQEERHEQ